MNAIEIKNLKKIYQNNFLALDNINLNIKQGEIFALLGPNGAGKTTLISTICGISLKTSGDILVHGLDHEKDYKKVRSLIGLVPQELTTDAFESVWNSVNFSRGIFGKSRDDEYLERILKDLSLWDKKNNRLMTLSGGMKRRVLIAKALSHGPKILFLDEPTAGVDVELRKDMWRLVGKLRESGVTIILTTHYIEEAEEMADRVGVINKGKIILVEDKNSLMKKFGRKKAIFWIKNPIEYLPEDLKNLDVELDKDKIIYSYSSVNPEETLNQFISHIQRNNIEICDVETQQSSLEEIFVNLVR